MTAQAPKRSRGGKVVMTDEDTQQYEEKAGRLRDECGKQNPKQKRVKHLMEATNNERRAWVEVDSVYTQKIHTNSKLPGMQIEKYFYSHTYFMKNV